MASLVQAIVENLQGESWIAATFDGGIWDRPLRREGPNATETAFETVAPYLPKRSIAVIDAGEQTDPSIGGPLTIGTVNVWIRVPDTPDGSADQEEALRRAAALFRDVTLEDSVSGDVGYLEIADRFPGQVDPWVKGGKMAYLRLQVFGMQSGIGAL